MMKLLAFLFLASSLLAQTTFNKVLVRTNQTVDFVGAANSSLAIVAPYTTASYATGNYGSSSGETSFEFLNGGTNYRIRQTGTIRQVKLSIGSVAGVTGLYIKVWRQVASGVYTLISTSEDLSGQLSAGSVNTLSLAGIAAEIGDYLSVRVTYSAASTQVFRSVAPTPGTSTLYSISNAVPDTTGFAWASQYPTAAAAVVVEAYMTSPTFVAIGDSIMAGNAQGASLIETSGLWVRYGDIGYLVSQSTGWTYQNMGVGAQSMAQIAARFSSDVVALNPRWALIEGGVNELLSGTSAATVMVSWDQVLAACTAARIRPVVLGVLPFRNSFAANDVDLQQRDALNVLLQAAVKAAGGLYINPDETVGSFYATGDPDNRWALSTLADSGDGLHLTRWGQTQLADAVTAALTSLDVRGQLNADAVRVGTSLKFNGSAPAMIDAGRAVPINQQGTSLTIKAIGASRQSTNGNGGSLILQGGDATGTGTSYVDIRSPVAGASGTADATYATRIRTEGVGVWMPGQSLTVGGNSSAVDTRFGFSYIGAPPGDGTDNIGGVISHQITNAATSTSAGFYISQSIGTGVTQTADAGILIPNPGGTGTLGRYSGLWIQPLSKGTVANSYIQLGGSSISSTPYLIDGEVTNAVYFAGNHLGVGVAPQGRYGTYLRGLNVGDGTDARTLMVVGDSTNVISGVLTGVGILMAPAAGGAYANAASEIIYDGAGSGTITNLTQLWIQMPTKGITSNNGLVIGGSALPTTSNPLRVINTNLSVFLGPVEPGAVVDRPFSLSDQTYQGNVIADITAAATLTQWQAVYMTGSSTWGLADANGAGTYPARGMAVHAAASAAPVGILVRGVVRNTSWSWTPGGTIYLSTTAGGLTQTAPSTSGDRIQAIGYALTSARIYVDFNSSMTTVP